jgi:hypothetical protein
MKNLIKSILWIVIMGITSSVITTIILALHIFFDVEPNVMIVLLISVSTGLWVAQKYSIWGKDE